MAKSKTTEQFINESINIHGEKYDYSKAKYTGWNNKVCIICPEHGEFLQTPHNHIKGQGCPICGRKNAHDKITLTTEEFIKKAQKIHGDKYDYSESIYVNNHTPIKIICKSHGAFYPTPGNFLNGSGCIKCAGKEKLTKEIFIGKSKMIHGDKYDYSKVEYVNNSTKVCIICPEHGEFWQTPNHHMKGEGCPICALNKKLEFSDFVRKAKEKHGDKYDYSKSEYKSRREKIRIICPIHGEFWQNASNHMGGAGCPKCKRNESKLEKEIKDFLLEKEIRFEEQKKFEWLKYKNNMSIDFFLPDYNIAIECQGEQHFKEIKYFGGKKQFIYMRNRDKKKKKLCEENGVKILYFSKEKYKEDIITDKNKLLENIKNGK